MIEGAPRCVAIANSTYAVLPALNQAVPDAEEFAKALLTRHQYEPRVLSNLERGELLDQIDQHLGKDSLTGGTLIVVWIGHGSVGADQMLRLIGHSKGSDVQIANAGELGEWAARTGARQVLVVIDTCFSGSGIVEAARLANAINSGRVSPEKIWFGVIAASLQDAPARSGTLVRELIRILTNGPLRPDFRWDRKRPYIRGDDLVQALIADWSEPRQQPHSLSVGRAWDLVHNPCFDPGVADEVVEHLLFAARGGSGQESYFTGRESALGEIVKWIRLDRPGVFVITGPPGCGKSAVAGRIASLSSPAERQQLLSRALIPEALDPGPGCVDGQLHLRGLAPDLAARELAHQLGVEPEAGIFGILAEAHKRRTAGDPLLLVIDGLDEARAFSRDIAVHVLAPLAVEALVLVATRETPSGDKTLISHLGPAARILDLGADVQGTREDIQNYAKRRLTGVASTMDPELVAEELAGGGTSEGPQFLLARLVTSQLREHPVDTSSEGWRRLLATTVESALERDLQSVTLTISGKPHPHAAREMIYALALAYGAGFPADDIWPAVATAVSLTGTTYTREDCYAVLTALGRHLIAGAEGGQPVYRIAHQRLVDYIRHNTAAQLTGKPDKVAGAVGAAILDEYEKLLNAGLAPKAHNYLCRHAWRHLAEACPEGLTGLRHLVERDRAAFLPDLAAALEFVASEAMSAGHADQAVQFSREAIDLRREVGDRLELAMGFFSLALVEGTSGNSAAAEQASTKAIELARQASDSPEGRRVLSAVLLARAHTQLLDGHAKGALLIAQEAVNLLEAAGVTPPKDKSVARAAAYNVIGRAAFLLGDLETAVTNSQRALDLVSAQSAGNHLRDLRNEALSVLASIQVQHAISSLPGDESQRPVTSSAAELMLDEYRRVGPQGTVGDLMLANGLISYVRDRSRGFQGPVDGALLGLLNEAIALVSPFAQEVMGAAIILGEGMALLLRLAPQAPAPGYPLAEQCLRRFTDTNNLAACVLGSLLVSKHISQVPQVMNGTAADAAGVAAAFKEAVALLRKNDAWFVRFQLAEALSLLSTLLLHPAFASSEQDIAARADAIEIWRSLTAKFAVAAVNLVSMLCDQAARLLEGSVAEAADLAREATALARTLPQARFSGLLALAETNLAGAQLALGELSTTPELLKGAIARLEPLAEHPLFSGVLATACMNLAQVQMQEGHFAAALSSAERASALLAKPDLLPLAAPNRSLALLTLGQARRANGQEQLANQILRPLIEELCVHARADRAGVFGLARALNLGAPDSWQEVLAGFDDRPDIYRILNILRYRTSAEIPATVKDLLDALNTRPATEHRELRQIARVQRLRKPAEFDAAWQKEALTLPLWLQISGAHERLVMAWCNSPNWVVSREYLKSHPALLEAITDVVLDEFALDGSNLQLRRELLQEARMRGADAAYAPLLARIEVNDWAESEDPERHFAEHPELLRPEIRAVVQNDVTTGDPDSALLAAILDLAQRGESQLAFQALRDPDSMLEHLQAGCRFNDMTRLVSLATLVKLCTKTDSAKRIATATLAIACALEATAGKPGTAGESEKLIAEAVEGSDASDRQQLLTIVTDAIKHHPDSISHLARLVQAFDTSSLG